METPVRLCCGQRHIGPICPDGKVMCQLCFDRFDTNDLAIDPEDGKKWDVCIECAANEVSLERKKKEN